MVGKVRLQWDRLRDCISISGLRSTCEFVDFHGLVNSSCLMIEDCLAVQLVLQGELRLVVVDVCWNHSHLRQRVNCLVFLFALLLAGAPRVDS